MIRPCRQPIVTLLCLLLLGGALVSAEDGPDPYEHETKEQRDERMAWWREARFGMFIHWGVYAVPAGTHKGKQVPGIGEWIMQRGKIPCAEYRLFAKQFNPVKYDPDSWVRLAQRAGMKYIVITAKHHDGFTLYPSAVSDWGIGITPYGKDLLKPLAEACRKHGIKLGFYYSHDQDWMNGGFNNTWDPANKRDLNEYTAQVAVPQVRELLTNYGPDVPAVLWWDTPFSMTEERARPLIELLKLKPGIIHNNRLLNHRGPSAFPGDTETPEQHIPATGFKDRDWETCMTMNGTWGYKSYDHNWKSTETLIRNLIDIASKGGNYLLNVGPTAEGLIPEPSIERLNEVGRWMDVNGEAIYGTTASAFAKLPWGRCTKKVREDGATLYLHVFDWPKGGKLLVPGLRSKVTAASLLAGGAALVTTAVDEGVVISLPATAPDPIASVIKLQFEGQLQITKVLSRPDANGVLMLKPLVAETGAAIKPEYQDGQPNLGYWTSTKDTVSWTFKGQKAGTYRIEAEVAGTAPATFTISSGKSRMEVTTDVQAGYTAYQQVKLGTIEIGEGEQTLRLSPVQGKWSPINLRALILTPQAEPGADTSRMGNPPAAWPGNKNDFHGFSQYDFQLNGNGCKVVVPKEIADGKPWIWRTRFWGHEPQTDLALLERGFYVAYTDVANLFGSPEAVARWDAFYKLLTDKHGLSPKVVLEAMSRGGLIAYKWAAQNPAKVACIYADAPVCDFKSWPGGKGNSSGNEGAWRQCLQAYGMTEAEALAYKENPVDNLEALAKAKVPLLHVVGDADEVVPVAENTAIVEKRYKELGGPIQVIQKEGGGHHPHSLKDPQPIVDFILQNTRQ